MMDQVQEWMTATVVSISPEATIDDADALLVDHEIRRLTVVDDGELTGVVSQGDVRVAKATAAADRSESAAPPTVGTIMTPDPISIPATATIALAAQTMLQVKVGGLPVVDQNGELCGILSESDLFRYIVTNSE